MAKSETHIIRPAGRHILTIGRDLIQDKYAAIVELVKNAYDADSQDISITFKSTAEKDLFKIFVEDHGHGMSLDTVVNKWLVPSTDDKLKRNISPSGRIMQGRKGIGRYAASILGKDIFLETTFEGQTTTLYLEWSAFERAEYLDDVEILVESAKTDRPNGTSITISGDAEMLREWDSKQLDKLHFELKKLISPSAIRLKAGTQEDSFAIHLKFDNFIENGVHVKTVEPYPIVDLFDYRISGLIANNGKGQLLYENQKTRNSIKESIPFDFGKPTGCGALEFDIRVYDRESDSIDLLIARGLKDDSGKFLGKLEARKLLNSLNGIGVYRNGFRIRPLGDPDFDWLQLNEKRVQNPSMRIGSNQAIGYVLIQSEEESSLKEKSARDGLGENNAYKSFKEISAKVIAALEEKRFDYRLKAGLSRPAIKIEKELERLFEFDELKSGIRKRLVKYGVNPEVAEDIIGIITKEETEKNRIVDDIRQTVAIYQGQATLGKIINVILHEGRRPLNYFKNQIPNLEFWAADVNLQKNREQFSSRILPLTAGLKENSQMMVNLFSRIDPLATGKRSPKASFVLKDVIDGAFAVFEHEFDKYGIAKPTIVCPDSFQFNGWKQDFYSVFTNLIDNSLYWMVETNSSVKQISVTVSTENNELLFVDYRDTGPGIDKSLLETAVIFEPHFSTKPNGTGLGLAIAGESAGRNGLELKAFDSDAGAYFRLQKILRGG